MIAYLKNGEYQPLNSDAYYIQEEWFGADDTLHLTLPNQHPQLPDLADQLELIDRESGQRYLITALDGGSTETDITAALDLDELRATLQVPYTNQGDTAIATLRGVLPAGWTAADRAASDARRTISLDAATPLDVIREIPDAYGLAVRFDNAKRQVELFFPDSISPRGAYFTDQLNLTETPQHKSSTKSFATRLYAYGKDGLTFAQINDGKPYLDDHSYSDRVICAYWKDERYTSAQTLMEDARRNLAQMAVPVTSYECSAMDLARIDPEKWGQLQAGLYDAVILMDRARNTRPVHRVCRRKHWPHYPEKDVVYLSTLPGTLSSKVEQTYNATTNPNSAFQQMWSAVLARWIDGIAGYSGGNMVITKNEEGQPNGIMIMDTASTQTAQKILWLNLKGILYSSQGVAGFDNPDPSKVTVWSFENNGFSANWLMTGQLDANQVRVVNLSASSIVTGILKGIRVISQNGNDTVTLDKGSVVAKNASTNRSTDITPNGVHTASLRVEHEAVFAEAVKIPLTNLVLYSSGLGEKSCRGFADINGYRVPYFND